MSLRVFLVVVLSGFGRRFLVVVMVVFFVLLWILRQYFLFLQEREFYVIVRRSGLVVFLRLDIVFLIGLFVFIFLMVFGWKMIILGLLWQSLMQLFILIRLFFCGMQVSLLVVVFGMNIGRFLRVILRLLLRFVMFVILFVMVIILFIMFDVMFLGFI